MSFEFIGLTASQASAASQQLNLSTNQSQYECPNKTNEPIVLPQNVHHFSETVFEQNEDYSESSEDTVIEYTDSERNNMGNRQCTSKEQGSRSEDKEEDGDIWVKRDDKNSNLSAAKRDDKRKKKKQKYKDKTLNQNNGPGSTKEELKQKGTGNGQEHCGSQGHGNVEVKEIDRWAEVKMADEYSSSSTGYQTPEARTPKQKRKISQPEVKNSTKSEIKSVAMKPELPKLSSLELNVSKSEKGTVQSPKVTNTQEKIISQCSPNYASIPKSDRTKPVQEPKESISKTEALAQLDSLTNSPRSQRRHALLLSNEVAKYIPLPPEKEMQSTMTIEESPVVYSKIRRETPSVTIASKVTSKRSPKLAQHNIPKVPPRIQSETSNQLEKKRNVTTNNAKDETINGQIIIPSSNTNSKTEMRASTIEIMEDNRANELREGAPTETFEAAPGPGVAVLACIPPPEKALISQVPPPSPSSIAIFEEDEEADCEIDESDNRKSREMEMFNDNVCQRLSLLLETKELMEDKIDDSAESVEDVENALQSESVFEAKTSVDDKFDESADSIDDVDNVLFDVKGNASSSSNLDSSDDEYDENDYVQGSDSFDYSDEEVDDSCDFGMDIPATTKNISESKRDIARTPGGKNDATPLDMMNNNFKIHEMKHESLSESIPHKEQSRKHRRSKKDNSTDTSDELPECGYQGLDEATGYSKLRGNEKRQKSETTKTPMTPITNKNTRAIPTSGIENQYGWDSGRHDSDSVFVDDGELKEGDSFDSSNSPKRSRLDESIKALFKVPKLEQFPENEPAQIIPDLDFDITPSSDRTAIIEDEIIPEDVVGIQASARRRSIGYTESSDLDVSEQRDDLSTDSMLADDEDEGECLFSRTYPEPSGAEVLISCTVVNSGVQSVNDDKFWDDDDLDDDFDLDDDDEPYLGDEPYSQDPFTSDAYVDINDSDFDNARKQMQDIHEHLKNLKHQMNNLHDDIGGASCAPDPHDHDDFDPVGKRRALTD